MSRTYLDWNATAPLRPEARAAMLEATENDALAEIRRRTQQHRERFFQAITRA